MLLELEPKVQKHVDFSVEAFLDFGFDGFSGRVTDESVFDQKVSDFVDRFFGFADIGIEYFVDTSFDQHIERLLAAMAEVS